MFLLPLSLTAATTEYMNNDGSSAPETLDRAVEEGQIQREEEMQKEEEELTTEFNTEEAKEEVSPSGDAQNIQKEEEEKIDDNYLIGPYDTKGNMTYPNEETKKKKEELQHKLNE